MYKVNLLTPPPPPKPVVLSSAILKKYDMSTKSRFCQHNNVLFLNIDKISIQRGLTVCEKARCQASGSGMLDTQPATIYPAIA